MSAAKNIKEKTDESIFDPRGGSRIVDERDCKKIRQNGRQQDGDGAQMSEDIVRILPGWKRNRPLPQGSSPHSRIQRLAAEMLHLCRQKNTKALETCRAMVRSHFLAIEPVLFHASVRYWNRGRIGRAANRTGAMPRRGSEIMCRDLAPNGKMRC